MTGTTGRLFRSSDQPPPPRPRGLTIVVVVALVFLAVGLGVAYSSGLLPSHGSGVKHTSSSVASTTSTSTTTLSSSSGAPTMPAGCVLAATNSSQGYALDVYLSNSTKIGGDVCLGIVVQNVSGGSPSIEGIVQMLNITDSGGRLVTALSPGLSSSSGTLVSGHYIAGSGSWNSDTTYAGIAPQPGTYRVSVDVMIPQNGQNAALELMVHADFTLTG